MSFRRWLLVSCYIGIGFSTLFSQAYPDRHSTNLTDGWLSCNATTNPNPVRGGGHWIMYNLGDTYALTTSKIWNFNTPQRINSYDNQSWSLSPLSGRLEDGMQEVMIDISLNGTVWQEWGRFTIPKAPASSFYEGVYGPDFGGKLAKYILITGITNYGGSCYGLSEVKFNGTVVTVSNIDDPLKDAELSANPNPFTNQTSLKLINFPIGAIKVSLIDLLGRSVKEFDFDIRDKNEEIIISGDGLNAGFYILKLKQKDATKSIKLEVVK